MEIKTNKEYNPVQLNETINFSPDGKVLSKSLMFNLRGETSEKVWKTYLELRKFTNNTVIDSKKSNKVIIQEKSVEDRKEENKSEACPDCGSPLIEKSGISKKTKEHYHFWGCSSFPNCMYSKPFIGEGLFQDDENLIMFQS